MTATPTVAVVAVTYDSGRALDAFLDSLVAASTREVEVVLADNGSTDGSIERAALRPHVRVVRSGDNIGYGAAANLAVGLTGTEFVVVANPDIVWEPGSLDALVAGGARSKHGGAFGPLIRTPDGAVYPSARALPSLWLGTGHAVCVWWWPGNPWTARYHDNLGAPVERTSGWLSGSCVLVRRRAFDAVGGFDPSYFMYFEDVDLCERLGLAGWDNVYVPSAEVTHTGQHATSRRAGTMVAQHHDSAALYVTRHYPGRRWWPIRTMLLRGLAARKAMALRTGRVVADPGPVPETNRAAASGERPTRAS